MQHEEDNHNQRSLQQNQHTQLNWKYKDKDILFINISYFIIDFYFKDLKDKNIYKIDEIYEIKNFVFDNLNNFLMYNINQNTLINAVNNKLNYE
mgnify:CR=1 FL=1